MCSNEHNVHKRTMTHGLVRIPIGLVRAQKNRLRHIVSL